MRTLIVGSGPAALLLGAALARRGHQVTVYASYKDGTYRDRPYRLEVLSVPAIRYAPLYDVEEDHNAACHYAEALKVV